jgi:hypothetical protein
MSEPLSKIDSAVGGLAEDSSPTIDKATSPTKTKKAARSPKDTKAASPTSPKTSPDKKDSGVMSVNDLEPQGIELQIAPQTQATGW